MPSALLTWGLRFPEDRLTGLIRRGVAVDVASDTASADVRVARRWAYVFPDQVPNGGRERVDSRGPAPILDDDVSRFLDALEKDGLRDPDVETLQVQISEREALTKLEPIRQKFLSQGGHRRRATEGEIRMELEAHKAECEAKESRPGNQNARRMVIGERLRAKDLTMDHDAFGRLDKLVFSLPMPIGRPSKRHRPG